MYENAENMKCAGKYTVKMLLLVFGPNLAECESNWDLRKRWKYEMLDEKMQCDVWKTGGPKHAERE